MSGPLLGNCELTLEEQELVDLDGFQSLPTGGKDTWEIVGNFLIRKHAKARKETFHPLHRSNPVAPDQITDHRPTILFKINVNNSTWDRSLCKDVWRVARQPSLASESWKGFTIFTKLQQEDSTARSSQEHFKDDDCDPWKNWIPTTSECRRHLKKDQCQVDGFRSSSDHAQEEQGPDGDPWASWFPTTTVNDFRPRPDRHYDHDRIIEYFDC